MLHLAMKAFHPGQAAVPAAARRHDVEVPRDVRVPRPDGGRARARPARAHQPGGPRARASIRSTTARQVHTDVMKTEGAQAGARRARLRRRLRRRAARRGEVAREGARLLLPLRPAPLGPQEPAAGAVAPLQRAQAPRRVDPRLPALQLDRARRLGVHRARGDPGRAALLRRRAAGGARNGALLMVDDDRMPLEAGRAAGARCSVRFRTLGCYPLTGAVESAADTRRRDRRGDARVADLRARGPRHRPRRRRLDGEEEAGGILLMRAVRAAEPAALHHLRQRRRRQVTLIGRLLFESGLVLEDQLAALEADSQRDGTRRRRARLRAAARRPVRRARAGHHDRRRVPLLLDRRGGTSSSPTRPATSSTRATWSPAPRPPTAP